jgi:AraC-like DNA-binding protein
VGREAFLHVGTLARIPEVLISLGADPAKVCAKAGLDLALFEDRSGLISYRAGSRLFDVCVKETGCQHFGLQLGQKSGLDVLGFVGLLVKYSPDVRTALQSLVRYLHLQVQGGLVTLDEGDKAAMLGYEIYAPGAVATDQIADAAVTLLFNAMIALCGPDFRLVEVRFEHGRPQDVAPYRRVFEAPVRFDASENALVFSAVRLNHRLPAVEPELSELLRSHIQALEVQFRDDFPEQVRSILRTSLLVDQGSADQVAALLAIHSRTLHRRLAASGTNFRAIVDECRYEIARQLLEHSDSEVHHIAYTLDYADPGSFSRAFRRWSGTTPARWRVEVRSQKTSAV